MAVLRAVRTGLAVQGESPGFDVVKVAWDVMVEPRQETRLTNFSRVVKSLLGISYNRLPRLQPCTCLAMEFFFKRMLGC